MQDLSIRNKVENEGANSQGMLSAEEFNNLVLKVKELVNCVNNNDLETAKGTIASIRDKVNSMYIPTKVSQLQNDRTYATIQEVTALIESISGGGNITIPIVSELGDSLIDAISQGFFTQKYNELNNKIDNKGTSIATFDVIDGHLMMSELEDTNVVFSLDENGHLIFSRI